MVWQKPLRYPKPMVIFIVVVLIGLVMFVLSVLACWYIGNRCFWAERVFECEDASYVGGSYLAYIVEAVYDPASRHDQTHPVRGLRGRTIGNWSQVWEVSLEAESVFAYAQAVSSDGKLIALIYRRAGSKHCLFLDVTTGSVLWNWPDRLTKATLTSVVFAGAEIAYAAVQECKENKPATYSIYRLDTKTKNAELFARLDRLGFGTRRVILIGYYATTRDLIVIVEEGDRPAVYCIPLENPSETRLLIRLKKALNYGEEERIHYWHDTAPNAVTLAVASGGEIVFLRNPPDFSDRYMISYNALFASPSCCPDGQHLAVHIGTPPGVQGDIRVFRCDKLVGRIRSVEGKPDWLPDGKHLAVSWKGPYPSYSIWRLRLPKP